MLEVVTKCNKKNPLKHDFAILFKACNPLIYKCFFKTTKIMGIWSKVKKHPCNLLILLMFFRHFSCFLGFFKNCNFLRFLVQQFLTMCVTINENHS